MRKVTTVQNFLFSSNPEGKLAFFVLALFVFFLFVPQGKSYSATCGPSECSSQGKYNCQSDTMCCTGNGCPSWDCRDSGTGCFWTGDETGGGSCTRQCAANFVCYNSSTGDTCASSNCSPTPRNGCNWYCLAGWVAPGTGVGTIFNCTWDIDSSSTCAYCSGSGVGVTSPPPPPPTSPSKGQLIGRLWTDFNFNGTYEGVTEVWGNNASTCANHKNDFTMTYNSTNIVNAAYGCNPEAYFTTGDVDTGVANRSVTLGSLPSGYSCANVSWGYNTTGNLNVKNGTGCVAANLTVVGGMNNNLWWYLSPNVGSIVGRIRSDVNKNGIIEDPTEDWANTASACAGLKHDGFTLREGSGSNLITSYGCDASPVAAYYSTNASILTGSHTFTLGGLPPGYICDNTNVAWGYSTSTGSTSGSGCSPTVTINPGGVNALWWIIHKTNTPPTVTIPNSISYSVGGIVFPIKIKVEDPDVYGTLRIASSSNTASISLRSTSIIEINAYGNPDGGVWPNINIYGFRKSDGVRVGPLASITVNSATRKTFQANTSAFANVYSHFDLVFSNDSWNGVTGRDIWIDDISLYDSLGVKYTMQAENFDNLFSYDVGLSYGDANDFMTQSRSAALLNPPGYLLLGWGGALRLPALWVSPNTVPAGAARIFFNIYDEPGSSAIQDWVSLNAVYSTLRGNIWVAASGSPVNCSAPTTTHPSTPITIRVDPQNRTAGMLASGSYSVSSLYGPMTNVSLSGAGLNPASGGSYANACLNNASYTAPGFISYPGSYIDPVTNTLNIGLRLVDAKHWFAALGGDIYAGNSINVTLPSACPNALNPMCPSYASTSQTYFALGYGSASSIFSGFGMPATPSRYSESGVSATNLGNQFSKKNSAYFKQTLTSLIDSLKNTNKLSTFPTSSTFAVTSAAPAYITALDPNISSAPSTYTYTVTGDTGLAVMVIPFKNQPFYINNIVTTGTSRLIILADRDIVIGNEIDGTNLNPKTTDPHIKASIITTRNITFANKPLTATSSPGTLIIEGPVISGGDKGSDFGIKLDRNMVATSNELRPAVLVKFNPFYITQLNKIGIGNLIPALNDLFVFDFDEN